MFRQILFASALVTSVLGQSAYSDAKSGITFTQWASPKMNFGIALPKEAKTDFIAHIVSRIVDWTKLNHDTK
jgi:hypothetical protein